MLIKGTILQHESLATTPNNGHNSMVKKLHTPDKSCHTNKTWGICKTLCDDANCQTTGCISFFIDNGWQEK